jgi:hypothetical protein
MCSVSLLLFGVEFVSAITLLLLLLQAHQPIPDVLLDAAAAAAVADERLG